MYYVRKCKRCNECFRNGDENSKVILFYKKECENGCVVDFGSTYEQCTYKTENSKNDFQEAVRKARENLERIKNKHHGVGKEINIGEEKITEAMGNMLREDTDRMILQLIFGKDKFGKNL